MEKYSSHSILKVSTYCLFISSDGNAVLYFEEKILKLQRREEQLVKEKNQLEADFGLKRAKLKDLYLQQEGIKYSNGDISPLYPQQI